MAKTRLSISTDEDLAEFIKVFAMENRTTVADIFTQYVLALKKRVEGERLEKILSNPHFYEAIDEVRVKLQDGSAIWNSYDDVFGD